MRTEEVQGGMEQWGREEARGREEERNRREEGGRRKEEEMDFQYSTQGLELFKASRGGGPPPHHPGRRGEESTGALLPGYMVHQCAVQPPLHRWRLLRP